jgi:hypothetical protein
VRRIDFFYRPPIAAYYSLGATVQLFDDTQREIGLVFDGLTEMIDSLRPHPINYTNITLPRSRIVPQMQRFIEEAKEKDTRIEALQRQINALNSSFARQEETTDLRAEHRNRAHELEEERSFTDELEELQAPLYAQIDALREELSQVNDWSRETESQVRRDFQNEMDIKRESYGRFERSQKQIVQDAREAFGLLLEQLGAVVADNRGMRRVPRPKAVPADIDAFTAWTLQCVRARLGEAAQLINAMLGNSFLPKRVYFKPEILKVVQQGLQFQSGKILQAPIDMPPEFEKDDAHEQFPPTPPDEPDLSLLQFPDFPAPRHAADPPDGDEGEAQQTAADDEGADPD